MPQCDAISTIAAAVSAVGGAFAAIAAFRSASAAREAQVSALSSASRAALREIALTATEIVVEGKRLDDRAKQLKVAYRSLFTMAGRSGRGGQFDAAIDEKVQRASELSTHAKLFVEPVEKLRGAPSEEYDRITVRLTSALAEIRALREDLEQSLSHVEEQITPLRERALNN